MKHPIIKATFEHGQSLWLDYISRKLLDSGELARMIDEGVRGMTSNPTIFQQAIIGSSDYDADILAGIECNWSPQETFEHLAVADVQRAADALHPVYVSSDGADGFVSLEVSPKLAHNTEKTVVEAQRLWKKVDRPNLMIKVPGTEEGLPAVRLLLADGINVNVTLIFSLRQYRSVLETYLQAMEERIGCSDDVSTVASVASFFVSRVDTAADKQLLAKGQSKLIGKAAVANACIAYRHFLEVTASSRWKALAERGARVQRPLWASTSTKDPAYSDVLYIEELVAKHTVNTLPPVTLDAWKDHGRPSGRLVENLKTAEETFERITHAGVDLQKITEDLIEDGVKKFTDSYDDVLTAIEGRVQAGNLA
ncbi:transaldolase [bacterium]|nr:transaldolase [bacterium]MBU1983528.1 transaldolase [bacterium]